MKKPFYTIYDMVNQRWLTSYPSFSNLKATVSWKEPEVASPDGVAHKFEKLKDAVMAGETIRNNILSTNPSQRIRLIIEGWKPNLPEYTLRVICQNPPVFKPKKNDVKLTPNVRGFLCGKFKDGDGQLCSIKKSSRIADNLDGEAIWLGVEKPELKYYSHDDGEWRNIELKPGAKIELPTHCDILDTGLMYLTRKMVLQLLPTLQHFAITGELPSSKQ